MPENGSGGISRHVPCPGGMTSEQNHNDNHEGRRAPADYKATLIKVRARTVTRATRKICRQRTDDSHGST
ncbi:hypothetical protein J6590_042239 [Homalodisca vitripennis]|nr:hypothetical protein J6590_042239 [Homalodisca vitripennis]